MLADELRMEGYPSQPGTPGSVTKGQRKVGPVPMESLAQPALPQTPRYSRNSLTKPHLHKCEDKTFQS